MIQFARLCLAVEEQLGKRVSFALENPKAPQGDLYPVESAAITNAIASRKLEFTAGRVAARCAMAAIGFAPQAIPQTADRAPVWPVGMIGSISHCDTICLAAVARSKDLRSLGIDLEPDVDLPPDLETIICTAAERKWLDTMPNDKRGMLGKLIFSAKESAYKAQYPLTLALFGFEILEIEMDMELKKFTATYQHAAGCFAVGSILQGRFAVEQGHIFTSVVI
jgi:4'-phosphopantetheinyl transferase EntD